MQHLAILIKLIHRAFMHEALEYFTTEKSRHLGKWGKCGVTEGRYCASRIDVNCYISFIALQTMGISF